MARSHPNCSHTSKLQCQNICKVVDNRLRAPNLLKQHSRKSHTLLSWTQMFQSSEYPPSTALHKKLVAKVDICLLRTANQWLSSGELCWNTEHISFYFLNTFNLHIGSNKLFSDSIFCFLHQEMGYFFFFTFEERKKKVSHTKFYNILLFYQCPRYFSFASSRKHMDLL